LIGTSGLSQEILSFPQGQLTAGDFRAVSAREDHAKVWLAFTQPGSQLPPADAFRHDDIGEQKMDRAGLMIPKLEGFDAIRGREYFVT